MKYALLIFVILLSFHAEAKNQQQYRCLVDGVYVKKSIPCVANVCNMHNIRIYADNRCSPGKQYEDSPELIAKQEQIVRENARKIIYSYVDTKHNCLLRDKEFIFEKIKESQFFTYESETYYKDLLVKIANANCERH